MLRDEEKITHEHPLKPSHDFILRHINPEEEKAPTEVVNDLGVQPEPNHPNIFRLGLTLLLRVCERKGLQ